MEEEALEGSLAMQGSSPRIRSPSPSRSPQRGSVSPLRTSLVNPNDRGNTSMQKNVKNVLSNLEPQGLAIGNQVEKLSATVQELTDFSGVETPSGAMAGTNLEKIAKMSRLLTSETNALRESIKLLTEDIYKTKKQLNIEQKEDINFPYHLFLVELVVNRIHMKCDCFGLDYKNLVISAQYLGKSPIILYDTSHGKIEDLAKLNVGKSTLFAMTYDKICSIEEFEIFVQLTKQAPCSSCITKIAETRIDHTKEFQDLRAELCMKWTEEQPEDNILCTTSTPLHRNMYYLICGDSENCDSIGVIEMSIRMSFLGKEITTAFTGSGKKDNTGFINKDDNGVSMYSCQKVEMDEQGKLLLDEDVLESKIEPCPGRKYRGPTKDVVPRYSQFSMQSDIPARYPNPNAYSRSARAKYDEISTSMNDNELKIRVPKSTRVERSGRYDKIKELCDCESTPDNSGDQIQFEMPKDLSRPNQNNTYTSNLKYTYKGGDRPVQSKNKRTINVTPTNSPPQVTMEKQPHPLKDVFILKIGKKLETNDKKTDLEIELVTPKVNDKPRESEMGQQCSNSALKSGKKSKKSKKGDKGLKGKKSKTKTKAGKGKKK